MKTANPPYWIWFVMGYLFVTACGGGGDAPPVDSTPPHVTVISPANNGENIVRTTQVTVEFSEQIKPQTLTSQSFTLSAIVPISGTVAYNEQSISATFTPAQALPMGATVSISLSPDIQDLAGNALTQTSSRFVVESAPQLTELLIMSEEMPLAVGGNEYNQALAVKYSDRDQDIQSIALSLLYPDGKTVARDVAVAQRAQAGVYMDILSIDSEYPAGDYVINARLIDSHGLQSGVQTTGFTISAGLLPPVAITGLLPDSGKPGDEVVISGHGFDAAEANRNQVRFPSGLNAAEVVQAGADSITVRVPEGAVSGPVRLENANGRAESAMPFSVGPSIQLSPISQKLVVGKRTEFSCITSGIATPRVNWLINGLIQPDPKLGSIDARGRYQAPPAVPTPAMLTVRCEAYDDAGVFAEAQLEIIDPIAPRGQTVIRAVTGGVVQAANNTVQLFIPPNALAQDVVIQAGDLPLAEYSSGEDDRYLMAIARFQPDGLQFSQPVTVEFELKHGLPPGTSLKLMQLNEGSGEFIDTGEVVIVDDTGLRGTGQIHHFSTFGAFVELALVEEQLSQQDNRIKIRPSNFWGDFRIKTPEGLRYTEALDIPILAYFPDGPDGGLGPFANGISVTVEMDGNEGQNLIQAGLPITVSADGWQLGTVLRWNVTSLPDCNAGETRQARLVISYPAPGGSQQVNLGAPIYFRCLDEFKFSRDVPPDRLPIGSRMRVLNDKRYVYLETDRDYEFSELEVGEGAGLIIAVDRENGTEISPNPFNVANVLVTGKVNIFGELLSAGRPGSNGGKGGIEIPGVDDDYTGGLGGLAGVHWAGEGGQGATWVKYLEGAECEAYRDEFGIWGAFIVECPTYAEGVTGRRGQASPLIGGGAGGGGGAKWEASGPFSFLFDALSFAYNVVSLNWVGMAQDAYDLGEEAVKVINADENAARSAGRGGQGGQDKPDPELAYFVIPPGGGGGGGAGEMQFDSPLSNNAGGGGGGGGGGAPGLVLSVEGEVYIDAKAVINGRGGNGGLGGIGESYSAGQASPGGGGGGGNGAQIVVIADAIRNSGSILMQHGLGGIGVFTDDDAVAIVPPSIGGNGQEGVLRVNGYYPGAEPSEGKFHKGPVLGSRVAGLENCYSLYLGESRQYPAGTTTAYYYYRGMVDGQALPLMEFSNPIAGRPGHVEPKRSLCFGPLSPGMHTLSMEVSHEYAARPGADKGAFISLTPIERKTIYIFPGMSDSDSDGLLDGQETFLGTDPDNPDTDGDGYLDGFEVFTQGSDPLVADRYALNLTLLPSMGGTVVVTPDQQYYTPGSSVTLTANSAAEYVFLGWQGDVLDSNPGITISMDAHKHVSAEFLFNNYVQPDGEWLMAMSLETDASNNLGEPQLWINPAGDGMVAWRQDNQVKVRMYDPVSGWAGTETFGNARQGQPQVAGNQSGQHIVVWDYWSFGQWQVYARRYDPLSGWAPIETLGSVEVSTLETPPRPKVTLDAEGNALVMWLYNEQLGVRRYDAVAGWEGREVLANNVGGYSLSGGDGGRVVGVWESNGRIYANVLRYYFGAYRWGADVRISNTPVNADPRVRVDMQGNAHVMWSSGNDVFHYQFGYLDGMAEWIPDRLLIADRLDSPAARPQFAMDPFSNVTAVWKQAGQIWGNRYIRDFGHWLVAERIDTSGAAADTPYLREDGYGNALAVWIQGGSLHSRRHLAAGGWVADVVLATPPADTQISAPRVDLDDGGNALLAWREWNDTETAGRIVTRRFSTDTRDTDSDGLSDDAEISLYGTDPHNPDSDSDGLSDGAEVLTYQTDPLNEDTDADGLSDGAEVNTHHTDPLDADTDGDQLSDGDEISVHGTNPLDSDSDDDNLNDYDEVLVYGTNPWAADTDADGMTDDAEVYRTLATDPLNPDTDGDGLLDGREEYLLLTDPLNPDTDGDTLSDGDEVDIYGTNPLLIDTDGDGFSDKAELDAGTDPLDADSNPNALEHVTIIESPLPEDDAAFGHSVLVIPDVDGDGLNDFLVGAPLKDVAELTDVGQVYLLSNNGSLIRRFDHPEPQAGAQFGYALSYLGSDVQAIIIGAPYQDYEIAPGVFLGDTGKVFMFDRNGVQLDALIGDQIYPQSGTHFGAAIDAANEDTVANYLSRFGFAGILVGEPGRSAYAYLYDGVDRQLVKKFTDAPALGFLGGSVALQYEFAGDGVNDICRVLVGDPGSRIEESTHGAVYRHEVHSTLLAGGTACDFTGPINTSYDTGGIIPDSLYGNALSALDLLSGDTGANHVVGSKGFDSTLLDQGRAYSLGAAVTPLNHPIPQTDARFGSSVNLFDNGTRRVLVGTPNQDTDAGKVFLYRADNGHALDLFSSPLAQQGGLYGLGLNSSSQNEILIGAPGEDVGGNVGQGRVYLYRLDARDGDHDGLYIGMERYLGTNPNNADSDGDGFTDGDEVMQGTDPLDDSSHP